MADLFTPQRRSEIMSHIRSKNTSIEKTVFSYLARQGVYFQKHYSRILGKPDIALPRKKIAVFIDGDFWHGRDYKKTKNRLPNEFWRTKIENNFIRDKKNRKALKENGWKILRVWESEIEKKKEKTLDKIFKFLTV